MSTVTNINLDNICLTQLHLDLTKYAREHEDIIYMSSLLPGIQGINIGYGRFKEIIVKKDDSKIGKLIIDSNGIRIEDKDGNFLVKVQNWIGFAFLQLLKLTSR